MRNCLLKYGGAQVRILLMIGMKYCRICNEEHLDVEMIGEVCVSCASIMNDKLEFDR